MDVVIQDPVTTVLAIYGATLSTFVAVSQIMARRPSVKIELSRGFTILPGEDPSKPLLMWNIINKGSVDVTIPSIFLEIVKDAKGNKVYPGSLSRGTFPAVIKGQSNLQVNDEEQNILNTLRKNGYSGEVNVRACVKDAVGKVYKSKEFKLQT